MYIDIAGIRYRFRGTFDNTNTYVDRDVVVIGGSSFVYKDANFNTKFLPGTPEADSVGELLVKGNLGIKGNRDEYMFINSSGQIVFKNAINRNGTVPKALFEDMCYTQGFGRWATYWIKTFLMSDGTCRAIGDTHYGAHGSGYTGNIDRTSPTLVAFPDGVKIKKGLNGMHNTLFIDTDDQLWSCGQGSTAGHGNNGDVYVPALLNGKGHLPANAKVVKIGARHDWRGGQTSYCITDDHKLYLWGWGDEGNLGNGYAGNNSSTDNYYPYHPPSLADLEIDKCFMGGGERSATYAITRDGDLYTAGH